MAQFVNRNPVRDNLQLNLDFAAPTTYPTGYGNTVTPQVFNQNFSIDGSEYVSIANGVCDITRAATTPKYGGGLQVYPAPDNPLYLNYFLYSDFTWEVWFRINDRRTGLEIGYDSTEGLSALAVYRGYHAGFMFWSTGMRFSIWSTGPAETTLCSWTVGAAGSGADIEEGSWYQIAATKNLGTWTPYLNGENIGTGTTGNYMPYAAATTNNLWIGKTGVQPPGLGNYMFYSDISVGIMRMYDRGLSAAEINQNFQAFRGRYGL